MLFVQRILLITLSCAESAAGSYSFSQYARLSCAAQGYSNWQAFPQRSELVNAPYGWSFGPWNAAGDDAGDEGSCLGEGQIPPAPSICRCQTIASEYVRADSGAD
jgi:hypothetical protein